MSQVRRKTLSRLPGIAAASLIVAVALAGCATAPATKSGSTSAAGSCGNAPVASLPSDPDKLISTLPKTAQAAYPGFGYPVLASPWKNFKGIKGPLQIGASFPAIYNAAMSNGVSVVNATNGKLAKEGVTTPKATLAIMPDPATMSPAQQIQEYQQLVDEGVKGILLVPLSGDAIAGAVTAAGKKGVVTVSASSTYIPSPYAINVMLNQNTAVADTTGPILKSIGGKGNVLVVRGIPGESSDVQGYATLQKMLKSCPNVKVVGQVTGNYSNAQAKTAVLQFLASNPAKVDMVWQTAAMGPGVISAFQSSGRAVPPIDFVGIQAGDAAWWASETSKGYSSVGSIQTSDQTFNIAFDVLVRTLQGDGPLVNTMVFAPPIVTNKTVAGLTTKGANLNSSDEVISGPDKVATSAQLDAFFAKPSK